MMVRSGQIDLTGQVFVGKFFGDFAPLLLIRQG
jgi:hypothetical protein